MRKVHSVFINTGLLFSLVACSTANTGSGTDTAAGGNTTGSATATGAAAAKGNSDANGTGKPAGGVIDDTTGIQRPATGTNGQ